MFTHRPYSLQELESLEKEMIQRHQLSHIFAQHSPCDHRYRVKKYGRKEQQFLNNPTLVLSSQSCSICFKIRNTLDASPLFLLEQVQVDESNGTTLLTVTNLERKILFYQWLYQHELIHDQ